MADNTDDPRLVSVLEELAHAMHDQKLSEKQARKADKAILDELRKKHKYDQSKHRSVRVAKRVGKGALGAAGGAVGAVGKAAGGFIGREIGGIPIAGAIFRILGKKFANANLEKKQYKKTLVIRRKLELKEMAKMEKIRAKLDTKNKIAEESKDPQEPSDHTGGLPGEKKPKGGTGVAAAAEKMSNAAMELQATVISFTPAIQTFHETVEKMAELVDAQYDKRNDPEPAQAEPASNGPGKVHDSQLLEYLHGIEYLTQENAVIAENGQDILRTMSKDIGNIKWHTARQNGSVGRIEKLIKDKQDGLGSGDSNKTIESMAKDVGTIKWHVARISGSSDRTEKLLISAATDRIKFLTNQDTQIDLMKKQLTGQEEQTGMTMLSGAAGAVGSAVSGIGSAIGGVGEAIGATAIGAAVIGALPEVLAAGAVIAAVGGLAFAVYKMLPSSWFGGSSSSANGTSPDDNLKHADDLAKQNGSVDDDSHKTPEQIAYAKQNGRYADKSMYMSPDPAKPGQYKASDEMYPWEHDRLMAQQDGDHGIGINSAAVEASKSATDGSGGNTSIQTNNNSGGNTTVVQPSAVSAQSEYTRFR